MPLTSATSLALGYCLEAPCGGASCYHHGIQSLISDESSHTVQLEVVQLDVAVSSMKDLLRRCITREGAALPSVAASK